MSSCMSCGYRDMHVSMSSKGKILLKALQFPHYIANTTDTGDLIGHLCVEVSIMKLFINGFS